MWNPKKYLKFQKERTQAAIDLVARIGNDAPNLIQTIIDLGCGPGNSTILLSNKFPQAKIIGLDSSQEMLNQARELNSDIKWQLSKIEDWAKNCPDKFDLIFSNAAFQWTDNLGEILPYIFDKLNSGGILAIQVPMDGELPLHQALHKISQLSNWNQLMQDCREGIKYYPPEFYYNILSAHKKLSAKENTKENIGEIDIWETIYYHQLNSPQDVISWYETTGMKPYLEKLNNENERAEFKEKILAEITPAYPDQKDGKILFPFRRLFVVAKK
jgi:trans-aconitate 2-methyltransferase